MRPRRTPAQSAVYAANREARWELSGGWCEATGLHHKDCPGRLDPGVHAVVTHHVHPRSRGGVDDVDNLRIVWNGSTTLGAGGCHGRIETDRREARALGLLA